MDSTRQMNPGLKPSNRLPVGYHETAPKMPAESEVNIGSAGAGPAPASGVMHFSNKPGQSGVNYAQQQYYADQARVPASNQQTPHLNSWHNQGNQQIGLSQTAVPGTYQNTRPSMQSQVGFQTYKSDSSGAKVVLRNPYTEVGHLQSTQPSWGSGYDSVTTVTAANEQPYAVWGSNFRNELNMSAIERPNYPAIEGLQGYSGTTTNFSTELTNPFSAPTPIKMPAMDPVSVKERCRELNISGVLTDADCSTLINQAELYPAKITLALDNLLAGDTSSVTELIQSGLTPIHPSAWDGIGVANPFDTELISASNAEAAAQESDSEDETQSDTVDDEIIARQLQEELDAEYVNSAFQAPHPAAAGYDRQLPADFVLLKDELAGHILLRVRSKKVFRKWKKVFFVLSRSRLYCYDRAADYEAKLDPRIVYRFHSCMYIRSPEAKHTYGALDENRKIFQTTFAENITDESNTSRSAGERSSGQVKYNFRAPSARICKFGSENLSEITAFVFAINSVIQLKRVEKRELITY